MPALGQRPVRPEIRPDRAAGATLTEQFAPAGGIRAATWPDGTSIGPARPAVVHHQTDTFITTYTAIDPLRSAGGRVALDGFFGWPLTAVAS